ncbi:MAG: TIGR00296 family protein [Candidatus Micrarchaeota archaeon]
MLSAEDGKYLVGLARKSIESYFARREPARGDDAPARLKEKRGVFVTLETFPERELRGCIGYPEPIKELARAVAECAVNSAVGDPRFPPMKSGELNEIVVEISVLTVPELIRVNNPREYAGRIKVGVDGLIIEYGYYSGLLLPQVPVEWKWSESEFLCHVCEKAGLPVDFWLQRGAKLYRFQAQIFSELEPNGKVEEKKIG